MSAHWFDQIIAIMAKQMTLTTGFEISGDPVARGH